MRSWEQNLLQQQISASFFTSCCLSFPTVVVSEYLSLTGSDTAFNIFFVLSSFALLPRIFSVSNSSSLNRGLNQVRIRFAPGSFVDGNFFSKNIQPRHLSLETTSGNFSIDNHFLREQIDP
ncbi:hypothetical protein TNCV_1850551 [Trichonephila clavipes]|nr:hypothetical protein TNCV_1850551 [Trichonephila clavipes]